MISKQQSLVLSLLLALSISAAGQWQSLPDINGANIEDLKSVGDTILVAGTSEGLYFSPIQSPLSWQLWHAPFNQEFVDFAASENVLLATSDFVMYRSTDGGSTWITASNNLSGIIYDLEIMGDHLFVATSDGLFKSDNQAIDWEEVSLPDSIAEKGVTQIARTDSLLLVGVVGGSILQSIDTAQ